jgi:hypothetical protein
MALPVPVLFHRLHGHFATRHVPPYARAREMVALPLKKPFLLAKYLQWRRSQILLTAGLPSGMPLS